MPYIYKFKKMWRSRIFSERQSPSFTSRWKKKKNVPHILTNCVHHHVSATRSMNPVKWSPRIYDAKNTPIRTIVDKEHYNILNFVLQRWSIPRRRGKASRGRWGHWRVTSIPQVSSSQRLLYIPTPLTYICSKSISITYIIHVSYVYEITEPFEYVLQANCATCCFWQAAMYGYNSQFTSWQIILLLFSIFSFFFGTYTCVRTRCFR